MKQLSLCLITIFIVISSCKLLNNPTQQDETPVDTSQPVSNHPLNGEWKWFKTFVIYGLGGFDTVTPEEAGFQEYLKISITDNDSIYKKYHDEVIIDSGTLKLYNFMEYEKTDSSKALRFYSDSLADVPPCSACFVDTTPPSTATIYSINKDTLVLSLGYKSVIADLGGSANYYIKIK